jgi:metal-responsive CopG/Arc/MetJ family transcriptional regulator
MAIILVMDEVLYRASMASRPIQVSMETGLLERIDADPETRARGRSAFLRSAAELYLSAKDKRAIDEGIRRAYAGQAEVMADEIAELLPSQEWPSP